MKRKITILSMLIGSALLGFGQNYVSSVWIADKGDGTYVNPIINADYSDPDVCAVGDDFYMTASSFGCTPAVPILHSKDLVNWRIINYAVKKLIPEEFFDKPQHGRGVWAPSIRYHNGEFYIYWGDPDFGIYMIKTNDPAGEWSEPLLIKSAKGIIDTTPLWDSDGKAYMVYAYAASRARINSVLVVCEMTPDGTKLINEPVMVFDGNDGVNHTCEGPKFYKRDGYYYIMCPAGGVEQGWQLAMRSKNVYGPYESRIVMAQGNTKINGPHQGGWVETSTGESWFVHFQDKEMYGRVVHLNPMQWIDGWPVIGIDKDGDGCGEPVTRHKKPNVGKHPVETPAESDEFNTRHLGLQWQWHANYKEVFGFPSEMGFYRLYSHTLSENYVNFWEVPSLLLQKFPSDKFKVTTKLTFSAKDDDQQAGLIVMGWDYSYLSLRKKGDKFILQQAVCKDAEQQGEEHITELARFTIDRVIDTPQPACTVIKDIYLRVQVEEGGKCTFAYSEDGKKFKTVGETFIARQGKWIGAKIGLFCVQPNSNATSNRGWVDVDWFRFSK